MNIFLLIDFYRLNTRKSFNIYLLIGLVFIVACSGKGGSFARDTSTEDGIEDLIPAGGNLIFCSNWTEFLAAVEKALPGMVIQLKNGVYSGNVTFSQSGTRGNPVTIIPESRGKVVINGDSQWVIDGQYITIDGFYFSNGTSTHPVNFSAASSHCRFVNSAIVGWNLGGEDTRLISIRGSHNEVGHCVLRNKDTPGMMLEVLRESSKRDDHHIHHVYFGYFKDPGSGNGYEAVRIGTSGQSLSSSHTLLENCVFERCNGESEIISSKSGHNIFRHNTFLNSDGALTLRHGHDGLVENNFFINTLENTTSSRCNGVRVIGERQVIRNNYFLNLPINSMAIQVHYGNQIPHKLTKYDHVKDALIENNTLFNCDKGIVLGSSKRPEDDPPRLLAPDGIFRNNLIVSNRGRNLSLEIEKEVLSDQLFNYAKNVIAGKNKNGLKRLPNGVKFLNALEMVPYSDGLYYPVDTTITAGAQNKESGPLYLLDIAPAWVKVMIATDDPNFVGMPW